MQAINKQIILITGATDGLGKQIALDLAGQGATILLHGRSPEKGEAVVQEIRETTGNNRLKYYNADFASLDAVRRLAKTIKANHSRLDVLINNAGIGGRSSESPRELSVDGYELRFAVNYLAPFLLTHQLLPLLRRSSPSRIVNVASAGQQAINFGDVMLDKNYDDLRAYRQSKLALVMFTIDLAGELEGSGVTANSLHPASLMNTKMVYESNYFKGALTTVQEGAEAVEYLATSPDLDNVSGEYFDGKRRAKAIAQACDKAARQRLRRLSEQLTGLLVATAV